MAVKLARSWWRVARGYSLALLAPFTVAAQQPSAERLKPENGRIDSVQQLRTLRELHDGRVLYPNRGKLMIGDFATHTVDSVPKAPVGMLLALPGDSTLVARYGAEWVFLDGTKVLGMLPATNPVVAAVPFPIGADRNGFVFGVTPSGSAADSDRAVLVSRVSGERTQVGRLWAPGLPSGVPAPYYMVFERAASAPDGWIAFVRSHPYRLDWRTPTGEWVRGAPLEPSPLKMDDRERAAYAARAAWTPPGGFHDWPAFIEPFTVPSPVVSPDGMVLVKRTPTAEYTGSRYDVINRRGELVRTVIIGDLPADDIAGFGQASIYVWIANGKNSGLGHIERRPWP